MSTSEQGINIHTHGARWLRLARVAWFPLAAIAIGILILSLPGYLSSPFLGIFEDHFILEPNTPAYTLSQATLIASYLGAVGSVTLAIFLFFKKSVDPMGLFLSYYLLGHGILFAGPIEMLHPYWAQAAWVNSFILLPLFSGPATMALVALFPDGRFVPPWSRWLIVVSLLSVPISIWSGDATLPITLDIADETMTLLTIGLTVISLAMILAAIYAQVYRYRFVSTPEQRLQTKWVLYGIGLWLAVIIPGSIAWTVALQLPQGTPIPAWLPVATLMWTVSSLFLPLSLTISITRYRLFEIDLLINRTLLYGALTVGVIAIYIGIVGALGILFQSQGDLVIALLATGIVAVIFQPLREWLQRGINRLIFGERDDPIETLSRLGSQLETALPQDEVLPTLVETISQTLKLPYVAILLAGPGGDRLAAAHGTPSDNQTRFPLTYQGVAIGQLAVAVRGPGLSFSRSETRLLRNIARQAGAAVFAVHLMADLQRSRRQIIAAREEERRRLRRDLHDGIGPAMAGQMLKLDAALDLITGVPGNGQEEELREATQLLSELKEQTQESIRSIRRIVYGLRPPALDDLGLVPAIQAYVSQQAGSTRPPKVILDVPPEGLPQLPAAVEVAIYRIALEALTNVIHHAQAQNCQIRLLVSENASPEIHLEIVDDGAGMPSSIKPGVGLASMRERAGEVGGRFRIEPASPSGSRVRVDIPLLSEDL